MYSLSFCHSSRSSHSSVTAFEEPWEEVRPTLALPFCALGAPAFLFESENDEAIEKDESHFLSRYTAIYQWTNRSRELLEERDGYIFWGEVLTKKDFKSMCLVPL